MFFKRTFKLPKQVDGKVVGRKLVFFPVAFDFGGPGKVRLAPLFVAVLGKVLVVDGTKRDDAPSRCDYTVLFRLVGRHIKLAMIPT